MRNLGRNTRSAIQSSFSAEKAFGFQRAPFVYRPSNAINMLDRCYTRGAVWDLSFAQPALRSALPFLSPGRLLDIGCGAGQGSLFFAQRGFSVVGIDISFEAIKRARVMAEPNEAGIAFRLAVASAMEEMKLLFDIAVEVSVYSMIPNYERPSYARAAHRVLRKGGRFVAFTFKKSNERFPPKLWKEIHCEPVSYLLKNNLSSPAWLGVYEKK